MKFIKIISEHTRQELEKMGENADPYYSEHFDKLFSTFSYVQFLSEEQKVCLYAVLDDKTINKLFSQYVQVGISFKYEDMSKDILFGNIPHVDDDFSKNELKDMINYFIGENLDLDIVLDKINELGIEKLTEVDKKILELH